MKVEKEESKRRVRERNAAMKRVKSHFFSAPIKNSSEGENGTFWGWFCGVGA